MRSGRIESLKKQHSRLELDLAGLRLWPSADAGHIQALKRQKLFIKDQLVLATARHRPEYRPG